MESIANPEMRNPATSGAGAWLTPIKTVAAVKQQNNGVKHLTAYASVPRQPATKLTALQQHRRRHRRFTAPEVTAPEADDLQIITIGEPLCIQERHKEKPPDRSTPV